MTQPVAVFIDSANLHYALRQHGDNVRMDWALLREEFSNFAEDVQLRFYCGVPDRSVEQSPIFRLLDYLQYNGYIVRTKPMTTNDRGPHANMDVDIAIDMMRFATRPGACKQIYLFSGDGDFAALIDYMNDQYVYTNVVANEQGEMPCSLRLRAAAQNFINLSSYAHCFKVNERSEA